MDRAVAYYRVSTRQQQRSGLGSKPTRGVERFAEAENIRIIAELVEAETGKRADALERRPQPAGKRFPMCSGKLQQESTDMGSQMLVLCFFYRKHPAEFVLIGPGSFYDFL